MKVRNVGDWLAAMRRALEDAGTKVVPVVKKRPRPRPVKVPKVKRGAR